MNIKTISAPAIIALMTASIGLGALAPALAQDAPAPAAPAATSQPAKPGPGRGPGMGANGFFNVERGAEAIEIAIVRLSHRLDLTDEQTALLDTLKTDALAAADDFAAATQSLRPAAGAAETAERPSIAERFNDRIAFDSARLAALEAMQPAFTAFFDSLTDEQQAALTPERGERGPGFGAHGQRGPHDNGAARPNFGPGRR